MKSNYMKLYNYMIVILTQYRVSRAYIVSMNIYCSCILVSYVHQHAIAPGNLNLGMAQQKVFDLGLVFGMFVPQSFG